MRTHAKSRYLPPMPPDRRRIHEILGRISRPDERKAWIGILETHDRVVRTLDAELRRAHGLTYRDVEALARVAEASGGELSISALADRILLSPSRVSRLVAELERSGLVERRPNPEDGRSTRVAITGAGRDRLLEAGPTYLTTLNDLLFDRLTQRDVDALNRVWKRLEP
jgi:DNA-binding MarR family transcriptional regulator